MSEHPLNEIQNIASLKISVHATELKALCENYLSTFTSDDFFTFSKTEARSKRYRSDYYSFVLKLSEISAAMNSAVSELSMLMIEADRKVDLEMIKILQAKIDAYYKFEASLSSFADSTRIEISNTDISPAFLTDATNKLLASLNSLMKIICK